MSKFTVKRSQWCRGSGGHNSALLRYDGQRCCVGFYLCSLGVPDEHLLTRPYKASAQGNGASCYYPQGAEWLQDHPVYAINDSEGVDESEREAMLAAEFKAHGVEVEFVD